ncbi:MAG: SRPBCC family protein [Solirubrobacteraceae bacterium]
MDPFTVSTTISLPREEVFEYLVDIANHAEFSDHYLTNWHLLREDSRGVGAGVRFRIKAPLNRFSWADLSITQTQPPYRIVEEGRGGKYNRIRILSTYALFEAPEDTTRVEFTMETEPLLMSDRLMESLGGTSWTKRKAAKAIRRLKTILEEGRDRGRRPTVAAG